MYPLRISPNGVLGCYQADLGNPEVSDISVPTRSRDVLNQKLESAGLYVSNCGWTLAASYGR